MKPCLPFRPFHLLTLLVSCLSYATAAPYGQDGRKTHWTQPNGTLVELRVFGDESYGRTETTDGYTVVHSGTDNAYYYAVMSANGSAFVSSGIKVGGQIPAGLPKHLELPQAEIRNISDAYHAAHDGDLELRWNKRVQAAQNRAALGAAYSPQDAPVTGIIKGLTILAQFPNDPKTGVNDPVKFPVDQQKIVRFCNQVGYTEDGNTGSVHDYYNDQSVGKLNYTQIVTQIITLPQPRNYYNFSDYPDNQTLREDASRVLIADAIKVLKGLNFDFTGLTTDADHNALATNVFFAGPDSGYYAQGLWPQQWNLDTPVDVGTATTPVAINNFQITNIEDTAPVIGTFCHENGHLILGYPDIYSLTGEGVGKHCLMSSGNYLNGGKTPSPINAYFKHIVGWENLTDITTRDYTNISLPTTGNIAYRIRKPGSLTEFFIVENRGSGDKWAQYSVDNGIAIWHIDSTKDGNVHSIGHYEVSLEQADGKMDLENGRNRGDNKDLFDLTTPLFTDTTNPNANWWNGTTSSILIRVLSNPGSSMNVHFGISPPDTIYVDSPNGGGIVFPDVKYPIQWRASILGNVKIELYKDDVFHSVIGPNADNDGTFYWTPNSSLKGSGYKIRISSLTNKVPAEDFSDGPFTINSISFPPGGVMPDGWFQPTVCSTGWQATDSFAYEGKFSLKSMPTPDGRSSGVAYREKFQAGTISFFMKVSSELGYDFARFYIDNVPQVLKSDGSTGLSGPVSWTFFSFPLSTGIHNLRWAYEKDDSYGDLQDAVWIDGVFLPPLAVTPIAKNSLPTSFPAWNTSDFASLASSPAIRLAAPHIASKSPGSTTASLQSMTSIDIVDGRKFLTLTVNKPAGGPFQGTVEVSSNLTDWYSGKKFTTTLLDNETTLKIRDNTPTSPTAKRYIRFK